MKLIINTREDLDAVKGTLSYDSFLILLKGSMTRMENQAVYPEDMINYDGPSIEPIWVEVEDLTTITAFGFTKEQLA